MQSRNKVKTPGKKSMSSSDRFLLTPTREKILLGNWKTRSPSSHALAPHRKWTRGVLIFHSEGNLDPVFLCFFPSVKTQQKHVCGQRHRPAPGPRASPRRRPPRSAPPPAAPRAAAPRASEGGRGGASEGGWIPLEGFKGSVFFGAGTPVFWWFYKKTKGRTTILRGKRPK